ncbi:uncharacterized protein LOC118181132, partial [Stegodyphus dumicola]|uniref:uncharacterized protein LOC118181132 n=1 Tax=Stegodyphus dumicola TaxID=202533 RepID=UPI0015A9A797
MKGQRLIQDFIIPHLNNKTFDDLLMWDSEDPSIFKIMWLHKAKSSWTSKDAAVFIAWDRLKNRPPPKTPADYVNSKQRLRAALRNMRTIEEVSATGGYRKYRIKDMQDIEATRCTPKENKIKREIKSEITEQLKDIQGTCTPKEKKIERKSENAETAKPGCSFWQNADDEKNLPNPEPQPGFSNDEKKPPVPKLVVALKGKGYVCLPEKNKSSPLETEILDELILAPK